jgi:hypothetical protein
LSGRQQRRLQKLDKVADVMKAAASPKKLQQLVRKRQAPKDIVGVHTGHVPGQEPNVHYANGTSSTKSGNIHDKHKRKPSPSNKTINWLKKQGWNVP